MRTEFNVVPSVSLPIKVKECYELFCLVSRDYGLLTTLKQDSDLHKVIRDIDTPVEF